MDVVALGLAKADAAKNYSRGELGYVQSLVSSGYTATGALTTIYGIYFEITAGTRPFEIRIGGNVQIGNTGAGETITAAKYARVAIFEDGVNLDSRYAFATVVGSIVSLPPLIVRRALAPGTSHTYQAYIGSQDATASVRASGNFYMQAVEL